MLYFCKVMLYHAGIEGGIDARNTRFIADG